MHLLLLLLLCPSFLRRPWCFLCFFVFVGPGVCSSSPKKIQAASPPLPSPVQMRRQLPDMPPSPPPSGSVRALALHPTAPLLASLGLDRHLRLHDTASRACLAKIYLKTQLAAAAFCPTDPAMLPPREQKEGQREAEAEADEEEEEEELEEAGRGRGRRPAGSSVKGSGRPRKGAPAEGSSKGGGGKKRQKGLKQKRQQCGDDSD